MEVVALLCSGELGEYRVWMRCDQISDKILQTSNNINPTESLKEYLISVIQ